MPKNTYNSMIGAANRARVEAELLAAGAVGISATDLGQRLSMCVNSVAFYCRTIPGTQRAGLSSNHHVRWFHSTQAAGAEAYKAQLLAQRDAPRLRPRWSDATADEAIELVHKAGDAGLNADALVAALGLNISTASSLLSHLHKTEKVKARNEAKGHRRYFGLHVDVQPLKRKRKSMAKPKHLHKKPGPKAGTPKPAKTAKQRPALKPAYAMPRVSAFDSAEPIIPAGLKPIDCPGCNDTRYTVQKPEPFFSAMTPGSYLHTGSAIERAYGGGR